MPPRAMRARAPADVNAAWYDNWASGPEELTAPDDTEFVPMIWGRGFVRSSTSMLSSLPYLERYAWFTLSTQTHRTGLYDGATPNSSGTAYREAG